MKRLPETIIFGKGLGAFTDNLTPWRMMQGLGKFTEGGGITKMGDAFAQSIGIGSGAAPSVIDGYAKAGLNPTYEYGFREQKAATPQLTPKVQQPAQPHAGTISRPNADISSILAANDRAQADPNQGLGGSLLNPGGFNNQKGL